MEAMCQAATRVDAITPVVSALSPLSPGIVIHNAMMLVRKDWCQKH